MTAVPNFLDVPGTKTPFLSQLQMKQGPVNFINIFVLESKEKEKDFLQNWERDGNHMKKQPGMLSAQLYKGIGEEANIYVNVALWESTEQFHRAFHDPEFKKHLVGFPAGTNVYPLIATKHAMKGVCTT